MVNIIKKFITKSILTISLITIFGVGIVGYASYRVGNWKTQGVNTIEDERDVVVSKVIRNFDPTLALDILTAINIKNDIEIPLFSIFTVGEGGGGELETRLMAENLNQTVIFTTGLLPPINGIEFIFANLSATTTATATPTLALNSGVPNRASTFNRSLQVGKNFASSEIDENYTLCEGFLFADCDTPLTGADIVAEDDYEGKGSIYSQENIKALGSVQGDDYLSGDGSQGATILNQAYVCLDFSGVSNICSEWCLLEIKDGLITNMNNCFDVEI